MKATTLRCARNRLSCSTRILEPPASAAAVRYECVERHWRALTWPGSLVAAPRRAAAVMRAEKRRAGAMALAASGLRGYMGDKLRVRSLRRWLRAPAKREPPRLPHLEL